MDVFRRLCGAAGGPGRGVCCPPPGVGPRGSAVTVTEID